MYIGFEAQHYLEVGVSAIRCIDAAIDGAPVRRVLDLPCGYGRVLRFLKARFPDAAITACELEPEAIEFCASVFSVETVISNTKLQNIPLSGQFDLIWCGSLLTHLDQPRVEALLRFFHDQLSPDGVCVFTAHGILSEKWLEAKLETYGLTPSAQEDVLHNYRKSGFGYADYEGQSYGISLASREKVNELASAAGDWHEVLFAEHGWARHQDVYGFSKQARPVKVITSPTPEKVPGKWGRAI
jgi:SAM-dependent methyltransferase